MSQSILEGDDLHEVGKKLTEIYENDFRHSYSQFFPLIVTIAKVEKGEDNLDYLSNNLESIRNLVEQDFYKGEVEFKGLYLPLSKLSDHLNLEIARYNHYSVSEQRTRDLIARSKDTEDTLSDAKAELEELSERSSNAKAKLEELSERASNMQTEYTTILGIFAAIILAFTGSITFSSSVLNNIDKSSVYRLIIITLIIGFVFFNTVCVLIDFIIKINEKKISSGNEKSFWSKNWKVIAFDLIVILGIILTCCAYKCDWLTKEASLEAVDKVTESVTENPVDIDSSESVGTE